MDRFGQVGFAVGRELDGSDRERAPTSGARLALDAHGYPAIWDAEESFGSVHAVGTAYLTPGAAFRPTLAVRAGVRKAFGRYPFHEASFLGDDETVRLGFEQRFAGDAYANAEVRFRLSRATVVLPVDLGVLALYDVGRVWLDGETSSRWHDAVGGGLWFAFLRPENVVTVTLANGDDGTGLYHGGGFAF